MADPCRILALETSGLTGSVAVLEGDRLLAERNLPKDQRSAQSLAPGVQSLLASVGWQPRQLQLIAVVQGPGSFTGLRIGVTTAKTLAYALGCDLVGVDALEVLAEQAPPCRFVAPIMDAQRGELFAGLLERDPAGGFLWRMPTRIVSADWLAALPEDACVLGPALAQWSARLPAQVRCAEPDSWLPTAAAVGQVAWRAYQQGRRDDVFQLLPTYLRRSAAEEKLGA